MPVELTERDRGMLSGAEGAASALAMGIVVEMADVMGADRLIDVASAHVDSCLYHGLAGLNFAERLAEGAARGSVPTTLNVAYLDLLHPGMNGVDPEVAANARRQMDLYVAMGARPTWTCAPYQLAERPAFGEHVAWAESNAIAFCNSVLGARTNRYGDFIDVCAAITGRVPFAGLHRDEERLKAIGAAGASSGSVAMFHVVGVTPEAPTLDTATGGTRAPEVLVTSERLRGARDELSTVT